MDLHGPGRDVAVSFACISTTVLDGKIAGRQQEKLLCNARTYSAAASGQNELRGYKGMALYPVLGDWLSVFAPGGPKRQVVDFWPGGIECRLRVLDSAGLRTISHIRFHMADVERDLAESGKDV